MSELYDGPFLAVGSRSLGPFLRGQESERHIFVLSAKGSIELPANRPDLERIDDARALVERFANGEEYLAVVGGRSVLRYFLPYARQLDIAITDQLVPGDVVFDEWTTESFREDSSEAWVGGRTVHLRRTGEQR